MNKLILYILSFLIGIILYIALNNKDTFINISKELQLNDIICNPKTDYNCTGPNDITSCISPNTCKLGNPEANGTYCCQEGVKNILCTREEVCPDGSTCPKCDSLICCCPPLKIVGGWCQCPEGHKPTWSAQNGANTIIAGGFKTDGSWGPCQSLTECNATDIQELNNYDNKWLSVGGDNVGHDNVPPFNFNSCLYNAIDLINTFNMNGIAFDMEGCLKDKFVDVKTWINQNKGTLRSFDPNFKLIYVPQGDNWSDPYNHTSDPELFDYIAPMLYGGHTSYQGDYDLQKIKDMINVWTCSGVCGEGYAQGANGYGVPNEKLLITFQSQSANSDDMGKSVLTDLSNLIKTDGYAGILGWSKTDDIVTDNNNLNIINKIL